MDTDLKPQKPVQQERRRWTRFPSKGTAVRIQGTNFDQKAFVVNRCFGGALLEVRNDAAVEVGTEITVNYDFVPMPAVVRRIQKSEKDTQQVAVEWIAQNFFIRNVLNKVLRRE